MGFERLIKVSAVVCQVAEFVTMVVGFASPYWIQSDSQRETGFERMGLWEACFNNYVFPSDPLGQRHNGCFWIFHITYRNVWRYLNPEWLRAIQAMMSLALVLQMVTFMFVILYFLNCCPNRTARHYVRAAYIMTFIAFLFIAVCMIMFGAKADTDRSWLPNPDTNFISWSFGFCVLSGFFTLFTALALVVEDVRLGQTSQYDQGSTRGGRAADYRSNHGSFRGGRDADYHSKHGSTRGGRDDDYRSKQGSLRGGRDADYHGNHGRQADYPMKSYPHRGGSRY